jgi:hypothetical protein
MRSIVTTPGQKKIKKIDRKYLSGERNAENFAKHKVYRLLLLRVAENQ